MALGLNSNETGTPDRKGAGRRPRRSQFTSKSVPGAGAALLGSGGLWLTNPEQGSAASWMQPYAPAAMTLAGSFFGGYFIGWGVKRSLRVTTVVAAVAIGLVGLPVKFGVDASAVESWVHASVGWVGDNLDEAQHYLTALLPSAAAAGTGGVVGFRRTCPVVGLAPRVASRAHGVSLGVGSGICRRRKKKRRLDARAYRMVPLLAGA